jgi:mannose-6-phosphate isomerase class I
LQGLGVKVHWHEVSAFLRSESEIEQMVAPFLGPAGSVWGKKTNLTLGDWYTGRLREWQPPVTGKGAINIIAGPGAGLCAWDAPIAYFDLPKNELQYRMRANTASNLGRVDSNLFAEMYKRSYFVDWVVLNGHRRAIGDDIVVVVDGQREDDPNWAFFSDVLCGLESMAFSLIRARPWFEPGVWGGQWLKQHIPALSREEVNYAWSFELIAPENGVVFESEGLLLEIAFDWLMQWQSLAVLGVDAGRFGEEFPIRFDFLDTFGGGNLSIQCHPSLPYIKEHFGERITQDEAYYMLDTKPGSGVYLGFTETIQPAAFRTALERSQESNQGIDMEEFVQFLPAKKHDVFLIPNQTIHGSGVNNLVLEISATPYIFTFKMYDWMRLDLEGMPRPISIEHAFHNLDFSRKGNAVKNDMVSKPEITKQEGGMTLENLPTHPEHFYGIERITLIGSTQIQTAGKSHLLMVVEGRGVTVETRDGRRHIQHYGETFVIPAFAKSYILINEDPSPVILVRAFVKENQNHI